MEFGRQDDYVEKLPSRDLYFVSLSKIHYLPCIHQQNYRVAELTSLA